MSDKKIYCGSGKKQSDTWLKVTVNPEILKKYIQEYEGNKFVRLNINIYDKENNYGKDVSVTVDTWKPEHPANKIVPPIPETDNSIPEPNNDLPF